jgi:hypothetical protein
VFNTVGGLTNDAFSFHINEASFWKNMGTHTSVHNEGLLLCVLGWIETTDDLETDTFVHLVGKFFQALGKLGWQFESR